MATLSHEFVAGKLWLLVATVTLPVTALAAILGDGVVVSIVPIIGWFLLTPLLLLFGEEVADAVVGPQGTDDTARHSATATEDPLDSLKRRYAAGELDEEEFERRLERLLVLDEIDVSDSEVAPLRSGEDRGSSSGQLSEQSDNGLRERE